MERMMSYMLKDETDPGSVYADLRYATEFTITGEHLQLLDRAYVGWDPCEFGAPEMDAKRPYGNSDVLRDMAEILGIDTEDDRIRWQHVSGKELDEGEISPPLTQHLVRLHAEMGMVLQIGFRTRQFTAGRYVKAEKYGQNWQGA